MITEVIQPRNKAMTAKERALTAELFRKRYGAWYFFTYKKYSTFRINDKNKSWLEKFDKQTARDRQGW